MDMPTSYRYLKTSSKTCVSKAQQLLMLVAMPLGSLLVSSSVYADNISDLIRQKSQNSSVSVATQSSTTTHRNRNFPSINKSHHNFYQNYGSASNIEADHIDTLYLSEQQAAPASKQVLQTVRQMALDNKEIIKGSCWDYLNAAFTRAGVTRNTVFKGEYPYGPFVDTNEIQPGDWLYYVNHSYHDIEHSGLFVGWLDRANNQALILSYAGESRNEPARYKVYDVSHTYNVMRPSF